jgi:hypothetical protein
MEWMLEHANDVDIDVPLTDAQLRALAGLHAPQRTQRFHLHYVG